LKFLLIAFLTTGWGGKTEITETPYPSMAACISAGLALQRKRQKARLVWWNCEALPDTE